MGIRKNRLDEAVLTSIHNLCFEQKYKKYQDFLSESFHFLVVEFPVYLNRHVFVMISSMHSIYTKYQNILTVLVLKLNHQNLMIDGSETAVSVVNTVDSHYPDFTCLE